MAFAGRPRAFSSDPPTRSGQAQGSLQVPRAEAVNDDNDGVHGQIH